MVQPPRKNDAHNVQDYSALQLTDSGQLNSAIWRERVAQRDPSDNHDINWRLIPRNVVDAVSYDPEHIIKLVRSQVCTVFCSCGQSGCGSGSTCANAFNDNTFTTDVMDDSDTDNDDDTLDLWQWMFGTQTLIFTIMMMKVMTGWVYFYNFSTISAIDVHLIRF